MELADDTILSRCENPEFNQEKQEKLQQAFIPMGQIVYMNGQQFVLDGYGRLNPIPIPGAQPYAPGMVYPHPAVSSAQPMVQSMIPQPQKFVQPQMAFPGNQQVQQGLQQMPSGQPAGHVQANQALLQHQIIHPAMQQHPQTSQPTAFQPGQMGVVGQQQTQLGPANQFDWQQVVPMGGAHIQGQLYQSQPQQYQVPQQHQLAPQSQFAQQNQVNQQVCMTHQNQINPQDPPTQTNMGVCQPMPQSQSGELIQPTQEDQTLHQNQNLQQSQITPQHQPTTLNENLQENLPDIVQQNQMPQQQRMVTVENLPFVENHLAQQDESMALNQPKHSDPDDELTEPQTQVSA